ncbi:hypothetical protein GCM10010423_76000 [Streptomyces levis]|uniref:Uncharacterized protein n=1 Tax=Streptomyces levis TaxID=285566 RepID=A0ABP6BKX0_9ACTN
MRGGLLQGGQQPDDGVGGVDAGGDALGDVGGQVLGGRVAGDEARAVRRLRGDAVDAEGAPVLPVEVPGDQVPAAFGAHQPVRFDAAARLGAIVAPVREAEPFGVPAQVGELGEHGRVDGGGQGAPEHGHGDGVEGAHAAAQPVGQHLLQFGQGPYRGLADALDALAGGGAQADRHGDGLVVVEEQRRELGAGAQLVAAARARAGVDRVAQLAQPVDVPAQGAGADAEPAGQVGAGPLAVGLEQGQQAQQACRGLQHGGESASPCGQPLSSRCGGQDSHCPQGV